MYECCVKTQTRVGLSFISAVVLEGPYNLFPLKFFDFPTDLDVLIKNLVTRNAGLQIVKLNTTAHLPLVFFILWIALRRNGVNIRAT
jgi:hypothetical protein